MNSILTRTSLSALALWLLGGNVRADESNTWTFATNADYAVSDASLIEVADGVAKLKLQASQISVSSISNYTETGAAWSQLEFGPDALLTLQKSGGFYSTGGEYVSRVHDGGVANRWDSLSPTVFNADLLNAAGELSPAANGLVLLAEMNNDWQDSATGTLGVPTAATAFTTSARLGSHAGQFLNPDAHVAFTENISFPSKQITVVLWYKTANIAVVALPIIVSLWSGAGQIGFVEVGGGFASPSRPGNIEFMISNGYGMTIDGTVTASDNGKWMHIVVVADASQPAGSKLQVYKNGVRQSILVEPFWTTIPTFTSVRIGARGGGGQGCVGSVDEVAIFNRALSEAEVYALYRRPNSLLFQCRSGASEDQLRSREFVGPDGTAQSYYSRVSPDLVNSPVFSRVDRFLQYKTIIRGQTDGSQTPYLDAIVVKGVPVSAADNVLGDFARAESLSGLSIVPDSGEKAHLGLVKETGRGYVRNGQFTSRTFDAGASVFWDYLTWSGPMEMGSETGMRALWHMNNNWADSLGGYSGRDAVNTTFNTSAKLGSHSAEFSGNGTVVMDIHTPSNIVGAIEFWVSTKLETTGIMDFGGGQTVSVRERLVTVSQPSANVPSVYVNGQANSRLLMPGWNHVVVNWAPVLTVSQPLVVGRAGSDYFAGMLDEMALYSAAIHGGIVKAHYLAAGVAAAGRARFQVRASDVLPIPASEPFVGPENRTFDYFAASSNALPSAVWNKRYMQYLLLMEGDGDVSPSVFSVSAGFSGLAQGTVTDTTAEDFGAGSLGSGAVWYGARQSAFDRAIVPGLVNMDANDVTMKGLWHLDESSWSSPGSVLDATSNGRNGDPQGGASPSPDPRVGSGAGAFSGSGQYVRFPSVIPMPGDFTVAGWFRGTQANRCAVLARSDGLMIIELNGNGSAEVPGQMALVVRSGAERVMAAGQVTNLNDGAWHHVTGIRKGQGIHLYVDGARVSGGLLSAGVGSLGDGVLDAGRHPELITYFKGNLDELVFFSRALADYEVTSLAGAGSAIGSQEVYTSRIFDAGGPAIWENVNWVENGPFGETLDVGVGIMAGFWRMESLAGGVVPDETASTNNGTLVGSGALVPGRYGQALSLAGSGHLRVDHSALLEPDSLTVEAWVRATGLDGRAIVEKRSASNGYALFTDSQGRPVFRLGGVSCAARLGLRSGEWVHLAGVWDGTTALLYMNGRVVASAPASGESAASGQDLLIGASTQGNADFVGLVDEVAVHAEALGQEAMADHARMGFGNLRMQGRAGGNPDLGGASFTGPGGTNSYFTKPSESMIGSVPLGQYFQFRMFYDTVDGMLPPQFFGAGLKASRYPSDRPWVSPAYGRGASFLGRILGFSHVLQENTDDAVRYQLSGNGTNWYWWNGTAWENDLSDRGWLLANPVSVVNSQVTNFYDQLHSKVGGSLYFKAFLNSGGSDQTAVDSVSVKYSSGRLTVLSPNGAEVDEKAWLVDAVYPITWKGDGLVSNNLRIEYSRDGGQTWILIAAGEANDGVYPNWRTPPAPGQEMLVRIRDMNDASIHDQSDGVFHLTDSYHVVWPNGGETLFMNATNTIAWGAPGPAAARGELVDILYSADGVDFSYVVGRGVTNTQGSLSNTFSWVIAQGVPPMPLPSRDAKIRVRAYDNPEPQFNGQDDSDAPFTAAGITVTEPAPGSFYNNGTEMTLRWVSELAGDGVAVDFSRNNGGSWTNILPLLSNADGQNSYAWLIDELPSSTARIRIRSLSDPGMYGISGVFQLADVRVTSPVAGDNWELRTQKTIKWESGGAGDKVDIFYSHDDGASWTGISSNQFNADSNSYAWTVEPYPSDVARIKVVSVLDRTNLFDISPRFSIAGVKITFPNGGVVWPRGGTDAIRWSYAQAGSQAGIYTSLDGGLTWTLLGNRGLGNRSINWQPTQPTARALAKIVSLDPPAWAVDMTDVSDDYFTIGGVVVTAPTNGQLFTVRTVNTISWTSAGAAQSGGGEYASLYYTTTGGASSNFITEVGNNEIYPGNNAYLWNVPDTVSPSANAQIIVRAGPFSGISPVFTLRGIRMLNPTDTSVLDIGKTAVISWTHAGLDDTANGFMFLSLDGGATFESAAINGTNPVAVVDGQYTWAIPSNSTPSIRAVIKFVVQNSAKTEDINYEARTRQFILRGLKIKEPGAGDIWPHGSSNMIHLVAARAGEFATFYYAADGVNFDMKAGNEVRKNWALSDGDSFVPWTVEFWRMPSLSARMKAVSTISTTISEPFAVYGIKVSRPTATSIWAAGETNTVTWTGVGASGSYDVFVERPGGPSVRIGFSVPGPSIDWLVDPAVVGTGVVVRVKDSTGPLQGVSEPFLVVAQPTVIVVNPGLDNLWRVTDTYSVMWSKGGTMSNGFRVSYSPSPYTSQVEIFSGSAAYDAENNAYSIPWTVPDSLGQAKIFVENIERPVINDESDPFYIVGKFQVIFPNGGETNIYALKPTAVRWFTWGSVAAVNLFYSCDPLHGDASWKPINSTPIPVTGYGTEPSSYSWEAADIGTAVGTVRLRVEQADRPGAFDDSDADFSILYYTILWNVLDQQTAQHLNNLTLTESTGSSQSGLTSPVTRRYPYGYFDSIWSRVYFYDYVSFNWLSEPSREITILMRRSDVEAEYRVMANITYDGGANDTLTAYAWLERAGRVMLDPTRCTVHIYDKGGNSVTNLISTSPQPDTGVFMFKWDKVTETLTQGETYYARVDVEYSGQTYSSVITYSLRISADRADIAAIAAAITAAETNITDRIGGVSNQVRELSDAQALFRERVTNSLGAIEWGTSNLFTTVTNFTGDATNRLSAIAAGIDVIRPAVTNIRERLAPIEDNLISTLARILTRPDAVTYGSTNRILYKTRADALNVTIAVPEAVPPETGPMTKVINGIYEAVLVADWGTNSYRVVCSDDKASDSIILNVVGGTLYDVPNMISQLSKEMTGVSSNVTKMALVLDGIEGLDKLGSIATNLNPLIEALQAVPWGALSNVSDVARYIPDIYNSVTNTEYVMRSVQNLTNITGLSEQITNLQAVVESMTGLADLQTNVAKLVSSMGAVDLGTFGAEMSNMVQVVRDLGSLKDVQDQITNLVAIVGSLGDLKTLETNVTSLVGAFGAVDLGSFGSQLSNVVVAIQGMGELKGIQEQITNLVGVINNMKDLTELQTNVTELVASMRGVSLSDFGSRMTNLTDAIRSMGDLSNVQTQITNLVAVVKGLDELSALQTNVSVLAGVMGGVDLRSLGTQMTNLIGAIDSMGQLSDIQTQITNLASVVKGMDELATLKTNVSLLVASMGAVDLATFGRQMTNLTGAIQSMGDLSDVQAQITNLVSVVNGLDKLGALQTNVATLVTSLSGVNLATLGSEVTNLTKTIMGMQDLSAMEREITNLVAVVRGLQDLGTLQTNVSSLVSTMGGVDLIQLGRQMTNLTGAIGGLGDIDNLQRQITNMVAMLEGVGGLEALGTNVVKLTEAIGGSNLAEMALRISNTWVRVQTLGDLSGLEGQIAALNTSLGGVNLSRMDTNVVTVLGLVQNLGGMAGLSSNIEAVAKGIAGVDLTGMNKSVLDTLNRVLGVEKGVTKIQTAIGSTDLSSLDMTAVGRIETMLGRVGSTDRNTFFGRLNGIAAQLEAIGDKSSDTARKVQSAKTEAASAASGVQSLKTMLEGAQLDPARTMALLDEIRSAMEKAQQGIREIPKSFDVSSIEQAMQNVVRRMKQILAAEQLPQVPVVIETAGAQPSAGAPGAEPGAGEGVSKETIARLGRNMEEIDSSVRLMKKLMEEKFQTPTVEVRLQGVQ